MSETVNDLTRLHNFDLASFKKSQTAMIATSDTAYGASRYSLQRVSRVKDYSEEEVKRIIESGSLIEQQTLSRNYFNKDGYYRQLVLYYATLLKYVGLLIPNPTAGKNLSTSHIQKRYFQAMDYVDKMSLQTLFVDWARKVLVDGCFYGVISQVDKLHFAVLTLPAAYCQTRFQDAAGNDLIEFDVSYFSTITDETSRKAALAAYPKFVSQAFAKWEKGKLRNKWVIIPSDVSICFPMLDGRPFFLNIIPSTIKYDQAVDTEQEREKEEIRKIIIQKIPHLTDGRLLFEPDEAEEMHRGAVGMVRNNKNTTVLTTYADVDAIAPGIDVFQQNNFLVGQTSVWRIGMYSSVRRFCARHDRCDSISLWCYHWKIYAKSMGRGKIKLALEDSFGALAHGLSAHDMAQTRKSIYVVNVYFPGPIIVWPRPKQLSPIHRKDIRCQISECSKPFVYPHYQHVHHDTYGGQWFLVAGTDL